MYRRTRYIYDLTRKYYLLGRDRLLRDMELRSGDRVLEIGCGTARNLILLARRRPDVHCYGLDVSTEMLATAAASVKSRGLESRITLKHCFAEQLDHKAVFGLDAPFDAAFRVTASSEDLARTLLIPAARAEMLKLSCRWVAYDDGSEHGHAPMVLFEMSGVIEWDDILNRMLALVVTLSQAQAVPPSAYR